MTSIDKSDLPPTDLESMNRDHEDQVELLQAVVDAIEAHDGSEKSVAAIDEAVEDFAEHTREHFLQEDDQMRRYEFPMFTIHTTEHARTLERMAEVVAAWKTKRDLELLGAYVGDEFPRWLVNHVTAMDTVAAQFVAGNAH